MRNGAGCHRVGDGRSRSALYSFLNSSQPLLYAESSSVLHAHIRMLKMKVVTVRCDLIYNEHSHYNTQTLKTM